jgi:hypothetical protein
LRRRERGRAAAENIFTLPGLVVVAWWCSMKSCQAKREARARRPVRSGARKEGEAQVVRCEAFWKGKTIRTAAEMLWFFNFC